MYISTGSYETQSYTKQNKKDYQKVLLYIYSPFNKQPRHQFLCMHITEGNRILKYKSGDSCLSLQPPTPPPPYMPCSAASPFLGHLPKK